MPHQPSLFDNALHLAAPDASGQPPRADASNPPSTDTDLPLPLCGRSGNHDAAALQALRAAGIGLEEVVQLVTRAVDAPPLNTVDTRDVVEWIERACDRIIDPYRGRRLRRAVLDLLDAQYHLDYAAEHARRVQRLAEVAAARAAGTYWRDRDGCRKATRPIHVDVDPEAWATLRVDALRRRTTAGEAVGALVRAEVEARGQILGQGSGQASLDRSDRRGQPGQGRRAEMFARIAVEDETWNKLKVLAIEHRLTIARAVGLVIEHAMPSH